MLVKQSGTYYSWKTTDNEIEITRFFQTEYILANYIPHSTEGLLLERCITNGARFDLKLPPRDEVLQNQVTTQFFMGACRNAVLHSLHVI